jgi:hypothetical protein
MHKNKLCSIDHLNVVISTSSTPYLKFQIFRWLCLITLSNIHVIIENTNMNYTYTRICEFVKKNLYFNTNRNNKGIGTEVRKIIKNVTFYDEEFLYLQLADTLLPLRIQKRFCIECFFVQ